MPYVDLVSSDDYASIYYTTNSPSLNVSGFDPEKPTLVMLHSLFLDHTWLHPQFDDPRLNANFNIIAFDTRTTGRSLYRPTGRYDLWVQAADLAHCFYVSPRLLFSLLKVERVVCSTFVSPLHIYSLPSCTRGKRCVSQLCK